MTAPTISRTVLDHVRAYAAQVRDHLADLPPEQVEDLTDGLEADLAEALADSVGPVATGEVPVVGAAGGPATPRDESLLDLTRRFGPSAAYAAELRASAGLGEPVAGRGSGRRRPGAASGLAHRLRGGFALIASALAESVRPMAQTPAGRTALGVASTLRPLWWVVRGWLWFVLLRRILDVISWGGFPAEFAVGQFLPVDAGGWVLAVLAMLASLEVARRRFPRGSWQRVLSLVLGAAAVLAMPWAVVTVWDRAGVDAGIVYVPQEVVVQVPAEPEDGVYVDGILVSNLFVYDAQGNPLERVQIFDDRGRPVRTTMDEGTQTWFMPGVDEPWQFGPDLTADGRERWNVYPLRGVPMSEVDGESLPGATLDLRLPPRPFDQAPALAESVEDPAGGPGAEPGSDGS